MSEAFEEIVAVLMEADGYCVKRNVKLHTPRFKELGFRSGAIELDVLAIRHAEPAEVLVVECKAFARSGGVDWATYKEPEATSDRRHRYKLFWQPKLRDEITALLTSGGVTPDVPHRYCLASSATASGSHTQIQNHLTEGGMAFFDRSWLLGKLNDLGGRSVYQNCVVSTMASIYHHPDREKFM